MHFALVVSAIHAEILPALFRRRTRPSQALDKNEILAKIAGHALELLCSRCQQKRGVPESSRAPSCCCAARYADLILKINEPYNLPVFDMYERRLHPALCSPAAPGCTAVSYCTEWIPIEFNCSVKDKLLNIEDQQQTARPSQPSRAVDSHTGSALVLPSRRHVDCCFSENAFR